MAINSISSKDNDEEYVMHSKSDNIDVMINYKPEESYRITFLITSF